MPPLRHAVDHLRRLVRPRPIRDIDRALLAAFASARDEAAFAELVRRHGSLVLGVCRRVLGNQSAVDDAFQATFLLLARKAGNGGWRDSVAGWLHAAAWHIAQKARRAANRRLRFAANADLATLPQFGSPDPLAAAAWSELCQVLDEELARLPERLRAPLVLCYLEGRTRDEAAGRLGWSLGTFKQRLARARALLRTRLTRRGVSLGVAGLPAALTGESVSAAAAADVARVAAGYVCGEAVVGSVAELLRSAMWSSSAKGTLLASVVLLAGIITGVASRERQRPEDSSQEKPPVAHAPGSPAAPRDPLPPGAVARLGTLTFCPGEAVGQILTSVDGRSIFTLGARAFRIWTADSGQEESAISPPEGQVFTVASLLPGGDQLALSRYDGTIQIWDWKARREVRSFKPELGGGRAIGPGFYAFCADGRPALLLYQTGTAPLVDLATGKVMGQLQLPDQTSVVSAATFTPDGKTIVTGSYDKTIRLWDAATGKQHRQFAAPIETVITLAVSPDGRWLAAAGASTQIVSRGGGGTIGISQPDKTIHVLDLTTGRDLHQLDSAASGSENPTLLFTPDSRFLVTGADGVNGQYVRQWDVTTGKQVRDFPGHGSATPALAMSRDGRTLLTAGTVVNLWDWQTGRETSKPTGNPGASASLAFLSDGRLVTGANGLIVWDTATGRELRRMSGPPGQVDGIALAPDGRTLAVVSHAGEPRELTVFDVATGRQVRDAKAGDAYLDGPVISPDGRWLAAANSTMKDSTTRIWDYATLTERHAVKLRQPAGMLSFSADSRTLRGIMMGLAGKEIPYSIDTETGKVTKHKGLGATDVSCVSYSPDGRLLAVGGQGGARGPTMADLHGAIRLYETDTGKLVREFTDVKSLPFRIAFSPDGKSLASGGWDGTVTTWDVATGKRIREFPGHRGRVVSLAFSSDGKRLASGSVDTTVLIWDVSVLRP